MIRYRVAALLLALAASALPAPAAEVIVKVLHVEQNPQATAFWQEIARKYMAGHPGVRIELQYLENEAYKRKLTTLLQSRDRPNIIYSWAGGVLREQIKAGVIADLSQDMTADWRQRFTPAALEAYTLDGRIYGVPMLISQVGFFYNKALFAKAGVDAGTTSTRQPTPTRWARIVRLIPRSNATTR